MEFVDFVDDVKAVIRLVEHADYSVEAATRTVSVTRGMNNYYADSLADAYYEELGATDE